MMKTCSIASIVFILVTVGCKSNQTLTNSGSALPHLIIYKTKSDLYDKVPVILSSGKESIISYPDKNDISYNGNYRLPTRLKKDYLLDNQGITINTAFLSISYYQYEKIDKINPLQLYNAIIDNDPFETIYDCGPINSYHSLKDVNAIIESNFSGCQRIK